MPRRSSAVATWLTRAANFVFVRCTGRTLASALAFSRVRARAAFFLYRDSPLRRAALSLPPGAGERYSLYGLDEVAAGGFDVAHNLEPGSEPGACGSERGLGAPPHDAASSAGTRATSRAFSPAGER